jgi:predicted NUDIX family NTP pyrophosphohydrolase
MPKLSAGLLLYRSRDGALEVLLVHPGGPFWARKDAGVWSVPKGEYELGQDPLEQARREFAEELGSVAPVHGEYLPLGQVKQAGGKLVSCWAVEGDLDPATISSNTFEMEWPRGSGRLQQFPEVDRAAWFTVEAARAKLLAGQVPFLDRLLMCLAENESGPSHSGE